LVFDVRVGHVAFLERRIEMKKILVALFAVAVVLFAASNGSAALLMQDTLNDYIALGSTGGTIDGLRFFDFGYVGSGSYPIPASEIMVTPLNEPLNPGLQFNAAWSVQPHKSLDSYITFSVQPLEGGAPISDISASMAGFGTYLDGAITVAENTTNGQNLYLFYSINGSRTFDHVTFDPVTGVIGVAKDIALNGNGGSATVSMVSNNFSQSQVPVPPSVLLLAPGLLGLIGLRKRFIK
jgi:hypothetical protein